MSISRFRPRFRRRIRRAATRRHVVPLGEYEIHAEEYGSGASAIVLIHGLSGSARWWDRNIPELAEDHRVLIPDLVGFGRSPRPSIRLPPLDAVAALLARWMEDLELERVHVIGHSMGGQVAAHLCARHPERVERLVLVDAAGIPRPLTPRAALQFAAELMPVWRWGDPRFLPTIVGDAWIAGPLTLLQAIGYILRDDVRPLLEQIQAPTLVLWGERDSWVPLSHAWEMRQLIPDAQLAVLRGASHNPMVDRPSDFNRLVLRFLDGERVGR